MIFCIFFYSQNFATANQLYLGHFFLCYLFFFLILSLKKLFRDKFERKKERSRKFVNLMKMSIRYYKTKNGRMLASLPTGEMIEGCRPLFEILFSFINLFAALNLLLFKNHLNIFFLLFQVSNTSCKIVNDDPSISSLSINQLAQSPGIYTLNILFL